MKTMSQPGVHAGDQASPAFQEIFDSPEKTADFVQNISRDREVQSSLSAQIFQMVNPIDQFGNAQFASDECGDTMWNEENLNPPSQNQR
jgi:methyl-accepting chemotaxis protein